MVIVEIKKNYLNTPIFEHYNKFFSKRLAGIITDKQFLSYTQKSDDGFTHEEALAVMDKMIYKEKNYSDFYQSCSDISIAGIDRYLYFFIKEKGITLNQLTMAKEFLKQLRLYLNYSEDKKEIKIHIFNPNNNIETSDPEIVIEKLNHIYQQGLTNGFEYQTSNSELIIGKTKEMLQNETNLIISDLEKKKKEIVNKIIEILKKFERINIISNEDIYKLLDFLHEILNLFRELKFFHPDEICLNYLNSSILALYSENERKNKIIDNIYDKFNEEFEQSETKPHSKK